MNDSVIVDIVRAVSPGPFPKPCPDRTGYHNRPVPITGIDPTRSLDTKDMRAN